MKVLLNVIKVMAVILAKQNEAIIALQAEANTDNASEYTEADFVELRSILATLNLPDSMG